MNKGLFWGRLPVASVSRRPAGSEGGITRVFEDIKQTVTSVVVQLHNKI